MSDYAGYVLYDPQFPLIKYYFDKSTKGKDDVSYETVTSRQELQTFGRVPYVYYGGHTDFLRINLSGVFVKGLCQDGYETTDTARQQVDKFKELIKQRIPLALENTQGEGYIVDVQIKGESTPKNHYESDDYESSLNYIEIDILCTEIGRLENTITISHTGTGSGDTSVSQ